MVTRTVIELIDDLDGSEAIETVFFGLDGNEYEIDLAGRNAEELRGVLAKFIEAGRKTNPKKAGAVTARRLTPAADFKTVRAWAVENGIAVNGRGRVKDDIVQQYLATLS